MPAEPANIERTPRTLWVEKLATGDILDEQFQITRINLREYDKGHFLTLRLGDRTGKITAILWNDAEETFRAVTEGDIVRVKGRVGTYQQELQVKVHSIIRIGDPNQYDIADFLPVAPVPVEWLIKDFDEMIESLEDEDYKALLQVFRNDESLWDRFSTAPGAKRWHHPYLHGLLDHTLSVVKICRQVAPFYPDINVDLLVTGAVFHDCGKLEEYIYQTQIDFSTEGRLLGHLFQGTLIVEKLIERIPGFPREKRMKILHIIASHHGEIERSPVLPMTMEACFLHHIENMDAQMAAMKREMDAAKKEKKTWTGYIKLMERSLYLGETEEPGENITIE